MSIMICNGCEKSIDTDFDTGAFGEKSFLCTKCFGEKFEQCWDCSLWFLSNPGRSETWIFDENGRCPSCAEKALGAGRSGTDHPEGFESMNEALEGLERAEVTTEKNLAENVCPVEGGWPTTNDPSLLTDTWVF